MWFVRILSTDHNCKTPFVISLRQHKSTVQVSFANRKAWRAWGARRCHSSHSPGRSLEEVPRSKTIRESRATMKKFSHVCGGGQVFVMVGSTIVWSRSFFTYDREAGSF